MRKYIYVHTHIFKSFLSVCLSACVSLSRMSVCLKTNTYIAFKDIRVNIYTYIRICLSLFFLSVCLPLSHECLSENKEIRTLSPPSQSVTKVDGFQKAGDKGSHSFFFSYLCLKRHTHTAAHTATHIATHTATHSAIHIATPTATHAATHTAAHTA